MSIPHSPAGFKEEMWFWGNARGRREGDERRERVCPVSARRVEDAPPYRGMTMKAATRPNRQRRVEDAPPYRNVSTVPLE